MNDFRAAEEKGHNALDVQFRKKSNGQWELHGTESYKLPDFANLGPENINHASLVVSDEERVGLPKVLLDQLSKPKKKRTVKK